MNERPYRPSNGTDGECFMAQWCAHCAKREPEPGEYCTIMIDVHAYGVDDPEYPKEWVKSVERGPRCTAFAADLVNPPRCPSTGDLFDQD